MADEKPPLFTEDERVLLTVRQFYDRAGLDPAGPEARALRELPQKADLQRVDFWRREFPAGGDYAYVGSAAFPAHLDRDAALDGAFAAFNGGSGSEVKFEGPSASAGDVFVIDKAAAGSERTAEIYRIGRSGFEAIDSSEKESDFNMTPEQKAKIDHAVGKAQISREIGRPSDVQGKPTPNDPAPVEQAKEIGQNLDRQGVTMDKE